MGSQEHGRSVSFRPSASSTTFLHKDALARGVNKGALATVIAVRLAFSIGAAFLSPLASSSPDGLERVAEDQGFLGRAQSSFYTLLPDYTIPGLDGPFSTILAGIIGLLIVFALIHGIVTLAPGYHELDSGK